MTASRRAVFKGRDVAPYPTTFEKVDETFLKKTMSIDMVFLIHSIYGIVVLILF